MDDDSVEDPDEYSVEAIRSRRKTKSGSFEYYIKWEGFPESENTWEPQEHLKCPELIKKYNEDRANERRKKKVERAGPSSQLPASKRLRRDPSNLSASTQGSEETTVNDLFLEADDDDDDHNDDDPGGRGKSNRNKNKLTNNKDASLLIDHASPKGFDRGLEIERILTASVGDDDKLHFFLKWRGLNDIDMVDADELEKKGAYELCRWYRERLYWEKSSVAGTSRESH